MKINKIILYICVQIWLVSMVVMSQIFGAFGALMTSLPISKDSVLASNNTKPLRWSHSKGPFWAVLRSVNITLNGAKCMMSTGYIKFFIVLSTCFLWLISGGHSSLTLTISKMSLFFSISAVNKTTSMADWRGGSNQHWPKSRKSGIGFDHFCSRSSFGDAGVLDFGRCAGPNKKRLLKHFKTKHWDLLREWSRTSRITPQKIQLSTLKQDQFKRNIVFQYHQFFRGELLIFGGLLSGITILWEVYGSKRPMAEYGWVFEIFKSSEKDMQRFYFADKTPFAPGTPNHQWAFVGRLACPGCLWERFFPNKDQYLDTKKAKHCICDLVFVVPVIFKMIFTGWWFQTFFIFIPTWGYDPIWLIFFKGVETTN